MGAKVQRKGFTHGIISKDLQLKGTLWGRPSRPACDTVASAREEREVT